VRRAAVSLATNIGEGCARASLSEYANLLNIAFGFLREVGYYIDSAHRLGYLPSEEACSLNEQHNETAHMLSGLKKSLRVRQ